MSDSQAYEYRAFLLQISDKLSQEDSKKIAYLEDLPVEMESKPPLTVLTQLEMRGKVSASRPDDLAKILKKIERHDLAKKVKDFAKQQKKGRSTALTELQRLDHATMKLSANFQVTLLQCEILLHQVENLREETEKAGYKRVEEVVAEAHAIIAERFQRKLLYASKLIQEEQGLFREQSGESNPPSPDSQLSSLDFEAESTPPAPVLSSHPAGSVRLPHTINTSELRAAVGNLKAQSSASLPRSSRGSPISTKAQPTTTSGSKQPLMPPSTSNQRHPVDNTTAPVHGSLQRVVSPGPSVPGATAGRHLVQGLEEQPRSGDTVTQLVTGRLKPIPPPKPKIKSDQKIKQTAAGDDKADVDTVATHKVDTQQVETTDDPDYEYLHTSSYTGTGDSGFSDSRDFLRVSLSSEYQLPQGVQHPPQLQGGSLDASYCAVNGSAEPRYYKSLQRRDAIQGKHHFNCYHIW